MVDNEANKRKTGDIIDLILLKRVLTFARPYKIYFYLAAIAAISLSFLGPIRPLLINHAVDNYIIIPDKENLLKITILLLVLLFFEGIIQFIYMYLSTWIGQNVIKDLRAKIFKHIISLKMAYFDQTPIGQLVTRCVSDIETIADIFTQGLLVIIGDLLKLIAVILIMFCLDWRLAIASMLTIPILLVATAWFKRNIKKAFQDVRERVSQLNTFVQERIVGMNIIQIFNREDAEFINFKKINAAHRDAHLRSIFYYAVFFPIVEILSAISIGLVVWYGGQEALTGNRITIGELISFILLIHMMFRPIRQLADRFNILQMGIVGSERVFRVLDNEDKIKDEGKIDLVEVKGDIIFENVYFSYTKSNYVLKNFSFKLEAGNFLALVGKTGAGKTSVINILSRYYEIQKGMVKIDDININKISINSLRNYIALVQQDVFLFSDSIFNNVTLFNQNISREDVVLAAKEIGVHEFIISLPNNYDYIVGERGVTLSSGQRQLIAFLRIYVRNPKILILDEATSSIDTSTEGLLQKALIKLTYQRTTIVIAHRLSTIITADKILYLENGQIVEEGSHKILMNKKGKYYNSFMIQRDELS